MRWMLVRMRWMIMRVRMNANVRHITKFSCDPRGKQVSWNELY